jgi:hypothetical protein
LVNFSPDSKITLFKYIHIVNDLQSLLGKKVDLVEGGQLKLFAQNNAMNDKILIYERKAKDSERLNHIETELLPLKGKLSVLLREM